MLSFVVVIIIMQYIIQCSVVNTYKISTQTKPHRIVHTMATKNDAFFDTLTYFSTNHNHYIKNSYFYY